MKTISNFSGTVITPEDTSYPQVKGTPFSAEGAPALVVQPVTVNDVATAIKYAQDNGLLLTVRSGGHSVAGFATNIDGIVIDMSNMNSVELVDKTNNIVRVGSGAKWGDVANRLKEHHLALSSGDTKTVGVGGLALAGGIGWMVRKIGLTIDNLKSAEIVTADGIILQVNEAEHPDLFWAIRGGGGNFGVATRFEFMAHPLKAVYSGTIMFTLENLSQLLKGWRDYMRTADEALTTVINVMPSFMGNPPGVMVTVCYAGDNEATAMAAITPLKKLGKVVSEGIKAKPYVEVLEDAHPPEGVTVIVKNVFAEVFSDKLIDTIVDVQKTTPNFILQIRGLGGAMKRVLPQSTAFCYRSSEVMLLCPTFVPPTASEKNIQEATKPWQSIAAFGKGAYANFLSTATEEDIAMIYPRETYTRLASVKKKYDPKNIFNQNYNIKPA